MVIPTNYVPYISPTRSEARENRNEGTDEEPSTIISEPIQARMGFWGDDAGWCIYLKKLRSGEVE
jgi:hypothetical protein